MMRSTLTIVQPTRSHSRLGQFKLVDPHDWTDVKEIMSVNEAVFDALVSRDAGLRIVPGLAHRWEVSPDGRCWTFFLREGVVFHNGEEFDSSAARFSLERMAEPPTESTFFEAGVFGQYLQNVDIVLEDDYTIRLITPTPMADLLDVLVDGYMVPPKATQTMGEDFKFNPVGTGAFKFVEWVAGDRVVADANVSYFRGAPRMRRVVWKLVPESAQRLQMIEDRMADLALGVEPRHLDVSDSERGFHMLILRARDTCCYAYFFNCSRGPLRETLVRQAVNLAIDKTAIVQSILGGAGHVLSGFVGPSLRGYDPEVEPYPFDPRKASELLREAGYADGLTITVDTPTSLPEEAVQLSRAIADQLEDVGLRVQLNITQDRISYANKVRGKRIGDMCCFDSTPLSTYRVLREKISARHKGAWWQGYENQEVDDLLDKAQRTFDEEARTDLYRRCFRLIHDDPPWLFLYNHENIFATADELRDWSPRLDGCVIPQWV